MNPVLILRVQTLGDEPDRQTRMAIVEALHPDTNPAVCAVVESRWETPRYLMIDPNGTRIWMTEAECARALNSSFVYWEDGLLALDPETWVERPLTADEKRRINDLADRLSEEK